MHVQRSFFRFEVGIVDVVVVVGMVLGVAVVERLGIAVFVVVGVGVVVVEKLGIAMFVVVGVGVGVEIVVVVDVEVGEVGIELLVVLCVVGMIVVGVGRMVLGMVVELDELGELDGLGVGAPRFGVSALSLDNAGNQFELFCSYRFLAIV